MPRPRQFDEPALLDAAIQLFWSRGYAGTSIEDVARATTVGNGSIYAAYRSKNGLYLSAVSRYCEGLTAMVRTGMAGCSGDVAATVRDYLELIICDCTSQPGRRGCLMLNSLTLLDRVPQLRPIIDRTMRDLQAILEERLLRDLDGSSAHVDVAALSAHYVTLSQGLIQRSRLGHEPDELRHIADAAVRDTALALAGS
ncbi:TetR/AcrR family transcriptional regulator [Pimelobacter simplex]|uniref:TetR/AcrR family transcriptional regulator n=1 Tax=Nocardioides simplex TaxID=2045 RepID=UPI001933B46C|nr:TetR/AcrR family transcriptional regulator [Pimelobacter simplex]